MEIILAKKVVDESSDEESESPVHDSGSCTSHGELSVIQPLTFEEAMGAGVKVNTFKQIKESKDFETETENVLTSMPILGNQIVEPDVSENIFGFDLALRKEKNEKK